MSKVLEMMLGELGITGREASLYVTLLESGRAGLGAVAKKADLRRADAMAALERLVEKGLVHQSLQGARVEYTAKDPLAVKLMLKKKHFLSLLFDSGCLA